MHSYGMQIGVLLCKTFLRPPYLSLLAKPAKFFSRRTAMNSLTLDRRDFLKSAATMVAIKMAVDSYRQDKVMLWDAANERIIQG
jgi:hypothetical protein